MRSLFVPLKLATDARKLEFITQLDPAIDKVRVLESPLGFPYSFTSGDVANKRLYYMVGVEKLE